MEGSEALPSGLGGVDLAVVVGAGQLGGGVGVEEHGGVRVELEDRSRARGGERALDGCGDRLGLRRTGGDQEQVAGAEDGAEPLGEDVVWDLVER